MLSRQKHLAKKVVLILFFVPLFVLAYSSPGSPTGFVNDYAGLFSSEQKTALENKIVAFEKDTGNEIAVATIKTLNGDIIENFANELFQEWGIGKKGKDNGVLILVALDDRKMRIEVGYGLEGSLTDAQSYKIIDKIMKPAFREEKYYEGVNQAVDEIIALTKGEETTIKESVVQNIIDTLMTLGVIFILLFSLVVWLAAILARSKSWWAGGILGAAGGIFVALVAGLLVGLIIAIIFVPTGLLFDYVVSRAYKEGKKKGRKVPWWAGGGGSGGGGWGGFGGGGSGGGGASGGW